MAVLSLLTSLSSLQAQRQLDLSSQRLARNFERLSSGMRINRASDDAAGLAVASSLNLDSRVYNQGVRNLNDGISLLNIAEGSLTQLSTITERLKELATQSANGVYTSTQRSALNSEATALTNEFNRLVASTSFNGRSLLAGGFGRLSIQGGYGTNGQIGFNLGAGLERSAGTGAFTSAGALGGNTKGDFNNDGTLDLVGLNFNGSATFVSLFIGNGNGTFKAAVTLGTDMTGSPSSIVAGDFNGDGNTDVAAVAANGVIYGFISQGNGTFLPMTSSPGVGAVSLMTADINEDGSEDLVYHDGGGVLRYGLSTSDGYFLAGVGIASVTPTASNNLIRTADMNGDGRKDIVYGTTGNNMAIMINRGGGSFSSQVTYAPLGSGIILNFNTSDVNGDGVVDLLIAQAGATTIMLGKSDGTFSATYSADLGSGSGMEIVDQNNDGYMDVFVGNRLALGNGNGTFQASTSAFGGVTISMVGDFNNDGVNDVSAGGLQLGNTTQVTTLQYSSIMTASYARTTLDLMDTVAQRVSTELGNIASYQSRYESALRNLQSMALGVESARSRITDVDVALETASLVREGILRQSSTAVLAQANQAPALALLLLRNTG